MKSSFLIIATLLCSFAYSQNWSPFVYNAKYIYGNNPQDGSSYGVTQIRFDSVNTIADSTILYAYTKPYHHDSCMEKAYSLFRFDLSYPHGATPPWFPEVAVVKHDVITLFDLGAFLSIEFKLNAQKGESWGSDHSYMSFEKDSTLSFPGGISDSVKIYRDANDNATILSKNWGFIQVWGKQLAGIATDSVTFGIRVPKIQHSFKPRAGDILFYRELRDTTPSPSGPELLYSDSRDSLTEVTINGDQISVSYIREFKNYFTPGESYTNQSFAYTINGKLLNNLFEDGAIAQPLGSLVYRTGSLVSADTSFQIRTALGGSIYNCEFQPMRDLCKSARYNTSFGGIESSSCNMFGYSIQTLIGYRLNNITHGIITIGLNETEEQLQQLTVYPNPATSSLTLSKAVNGKYAISDLSGKSLLQGNITGTIDIEALNPGIYFMTITTTSGSKTVKVMKQ